MKIYDIIKYLLTNSYNDSRTWANFVRHISKQYGLEDPLNCLKKDPPTKLDFKSTVDARIKSFHENELREKSTMKYFNVSMHGLSGRQHPAITGIFTTQEVKKSRFHIKMLIGDLYTYQTKSEQSGGSPIVHNSHFF